MADPVAIVDPALGWNGAHHAGFAALAIAESGHDAGNLGFWCSRRQGTANPVDPIARWDNVHPVFSVDFYALFKQTGMVAEHWAWIRRLSGEYVDAFRQISSHWPGRIVRVIHHSLSWEHATALAAAIRYLDDADSSLLHLCFLMFDPGGRAAAGISAGRHKIRMRLAFSPLSRFDNVRLYASCSEYARDYAALLDCPRPLPVHPFFLGSGRPYKRQRRPPSAEKRTASPTRTLMYVGAVKAEKGFDRLPARLKEACAQASPKDEWLVHCFDPKFLRGERGRDHAELRSLKEQCRGLVVSEEFWDDATLSAQFRAADRLLLDYDPTIYRHKTSGMLWLAAWHDLDVILPAETWLAREAARLGVRHRFIENGWPPQAISVSDTAVDETYRSSIFQAFWPWVNAHS